MAEKVYVTRQTISNWENGKNYPDVKSLLLLSTLFHISLDTLVKGDLEEMREQIKAEDIKKWNRDSLIFGLLLVATAVLAVPLSFYGDVVGIVIWLVIFGCAIYYAGRVEKQKKTHDIQTYKEIMAFTEGKKLDEIEKYRKSGKRPYQKLLLAGLRRASDIGSFSSDDLFTPIGKYHVFFKKNCSISQPVNLAGTKKPHKTAG